MTSNQSQVVGFVGLGAMGRGMASTLVRAGFRVKGYDINPASVRTLAEAGGESVTSVAAAAGLGQEDDTAVVKVFEQLANITVSKQ